MSIGKIEGKYKAASKDTVEHSKIGEEMLGILKTMNRIEEKNRCARVRFLDALSVKLHTWGDKVKGMSDRIDSPCVIKIKEKK